MHDRGVLRARLPVAVLHVGRDRDYPGRAPPPRRRLRPPGRLRPGAFGSPVCCVRNGCAFAPAWRLPSCARPVPIGWYAGTRCRLPLPIRSARPMRRNRPGALRLEDAPDDRHAEARVIDVGVACHEDDVAGIPAELIHLGARHRQEGCRAETVGPVFSIGEEVAGRVHGRYYIIRAGDALVDCEGFGPATCLNDSGASSGSRTEVCTGGIAMNTERERARIGGSDRARSIHSARDGGRDDPGRRSGGRLGRER